MAISFEKLINELENAIGFYNPELKVYAIKPWASRRIWEYLCRECDKINSNVEESNKEIRRINAKTEAMFSHDYINQLKNEGCAQI